MEQYIKKLAAELGADVCGIGAIDRFSMAPEGFSPLDIYKDCKSVVAIGIALPKGLYEINPRLVYSHFNGWQSINVDMVTMKMAKAMEKNLNCIAVPIPSDAPNEYWDAENMTAKGLISMKHTAVQCGLGSIGKSSLLLNAEFGNRLVIGAILTNLELQSDEIQPDICIPSCRKCIDSCPVKAIESGSVTQKRCRVNTYGKTARGFDTVDCNNCRTKCPLRFGKHDMEHVPKENEI